MKTAVVALLLVGVVAVSAQIQVCDNKITPAQVRGSDIKSTSTNSGAYSNLKLDWPRPNDGNKGGPPSCITTYEVKIIRSDGKAIQQGNVDVSPAHTSATYDARGLNAGETYKFEIQAKGPNGTGPKNTATFTTAKKTQTAVPL